MRVVVQRVLSANCKVEGKITGEINKGFMLLVGFTHTDTEKNVLDMINKIINLRIMDDENKVMNRSILDVGGSILSISQFTLYADTKKGNRPSYKKALSSDKASKLYNLFNEKLSKKIIVKTGIFKENMLVNIKNNGPVTITLEKEGVI